MGQFGEMLFYLGAAQGILLFVFLFSIKGNRISNRLLGLLTLFWALILLQFPLQAHGLYAKNPHLLKTISVLLFTLFPLLYLHVKYLLSDYKKFNKKDLWHFLFAFLYIILNSDFYFSSSEVKLEIVNNKSLYYRFLQIVGDEVIGGQGIIYSILIFKLIKNYKKEILNYQSSIDKITIKTLSIGTLLIFIAWIIGTIAANLDLFDIPVNVDLFIAVYLIIVVVIYFISYVALTTPEVFKIELGTDVGVNPDISIKGVGENPTVDQESISLNENVKAELLSNDKLLIDYMNKEEPFLNAELSLNDLADSLDLSRHQLSNVINQCHKMNFYEFVNSYRIEKVKVLMMDPSNSNLKIISIAYDAGFNSKASFNRIFKQVCGMTPTQYYSSNKVDQNHLP